MTQPCPHGAYLLAQGARPEVTKRAQSVWRGLGTRREIKQDDVGMSGKHWLLVSQVSRKSLSENESWWAVKNWKQNNGDMSGSRRLCG